MGRSSVLSMLGSTADIDAEGMGGGESCDSVAICYTFGKIGAQIWMDDMSLYDALSQIAAQVKEQRQWMTNEEATKQVSIRPFIHALGYNTYDLSEVQPEFVADPRQRGNERVDFVIKMNDKPIILVEAKSAETKLTDNHWRQLHDYFAAVEVEFGILTNGIEYRFYADHEKPNILDSVPFLIMNILNPDRNAATILEGFTKSSFHPTKTANKLKLHNLLEREYRQPSDELVRFFARKVATGTVTARVVKEFSPLVKQAWQELVDREIVRRLQRHEETIDEDDSEPDNEQPEESNAHEVETFADPGMTKRLPVFKTYKGVRLEAILIVESEMAFRKKCVEINGKVMTPSGASKVVKQAVNPKAPAENGYEFWRFEHPETGEETKIVELFEDEDLRNLILSMPDA